MSSQSKCYLGDIRLTNDLNKDTTNQRGGYLQVCQQQPETSYNDWVLVCDKEDVGNEDTNKGAMHAACRQLGYEAAIIKNSHSQPE